MFPKLNLLGGVGMRGGPDALEADLRERKHSTERGLFPFSTTQMRCIDMTSNLFPSIGIPNWRVCHSLWRRDRDSRCGDRPVRLKSGEGAY